MALSNAEKNKRKRDRKKREREAQKLAAEAVAVNAETATDDSQADVEIEYIAEPLFASAAVADSSTGAAAVGTASGAGKKDDDDAVAADGDALVPAAAAAGDNEDLQEVMRRFQDRAAVIYVTDDETKLQSSTDNITSSSSANNNDPNSLLDDDEEESHLSKRKLKDLLRPTVAQLKQLVKNPELVEAHDVTAPDPEFLIYLKGVEGTVPVPRHWGRKRKYLQGKRGVEKPPFALPDFIVKTGICDVRSATAEDENKMSIKQKNRLRVSGRGGGVDVDYRTLYEAFFQHQTKPEKLTQFGDLYYEGKEYETTKSTNFRPGYMSERLREALGMANEYSPPPWLINMQRYGPPPSYPNIKIAGLNAPLPTGASYGYHVGGWGKPPVDTFGRPLYGGDPFGLAAGGMVTSDGKAISKRLWGALPSAFGGDKDDDEDEESSEEESSDEEMEESSEEEEGELEAPTGEAAVSRAPGMDSVLPDGVDSVVPSSAIDLRKPGDETPMVGDAPKQLYTILQQTTADKDSQQTSVFASDHAYVLPGAAPGTGPEGMASVLSKAVGDGAKRKRAKDDDEDADELGKKFKF
ncbi:hypothetical protein THAPSDRAFT_269780 [Thalassiosira pseudonana CCMP1335]|uniref:PSP proline-rich domain-containing protein n=1 Tax=Thalassiosira pseudonana TaxID=35128 RepID=B8CCL9_THAPS|nr:hypothetical protein THAPSDRAFT_269780 [Thalassiosira pseudonana CCMP1335]EED88970.1 hypothetical protein THAPSDRAFT_269780 [Thalassiosira pseudonana CCMP1335]